MNEYDHLITVIAVCGSEKSITEARAKIDEIEKRLIEREKTGKKIKFV